MEPAFEGILLSGIKEYGRPIYRNQWRRRYDDKETVPLADIAPFRGIAPD